MLAINLNFPDPINHDAISWSPISRRPASVQAHYQLYTLSGIVSIRSRSTGEYTPAGRLVLPEAGCDLR